MRLEVAHSAEDVSSSNGRVDMQVSELRNRNHAPKLVKSGSRLIPIFSPEYDWMNKTESVRF